MSPRLYSTLSLFRFLNSPTSTLYYHIAYNASVTTMASKNEMALDVMALHLKARENFAAKMAKIPKRLMLRAPNLSFTLALRKEELCKSEEQTAYQEAADSSLLGS
ncbi:hypothetical protein N0V83_003306 [Neocucurbitaria cava]|uniref:Uncharacterized protein n=1 Tax=Neocucurbitaria cava TaxID=798079 RepID=A0A9W8YEA5_9PLEO|nr:hypothetical protein N0V83_003306 [Neocucurbitaria cava]